MEKQKLPDWEKCPSVTKGGKQFFFTRGFNNHKSLVRQTVVWNRQGRVWVVQTEHVSSIISSTYPGGYNSSQTAKTHADTIARLYK